MDVEPEWQTASAASGSAVQAADGSWIQPLCRFEMASVVHCRLAREQVSNVTYNIGIDEIWFFTSGSGELWRESGSSESRV